MCGIHCDKCVVFTVISVLGFTVISVCVIYSDKCVGFTVISVCVIYSDKCVQISYC